MKNTKHTLTLVALLSALAPLAHASGDADHGKQVFQEECGDCHSIVAGKNKKGPSLFGVVGRPSASIAEFKYSDAMRGANKTWSAEALEEYIQAPRKTVQGGKMKYDGLEDAASRTDIIAFLSTLK